MRKHYTQMDQTEIKYLLSRVRCIAPTLLAHARLRMQEKRVTEREIFAALSYGSIVEAHNETADEIRVLVRGKVAGKFICVVVSLTTKTIVTVYRNQSSDFHRTLDRNAYQWTENLIGV